MNHRRFIKQLQRDNIDMSLFKSELNRLQGSKYKKDLKSQVLFILRSSIVQIILSALVLIDAVIVITEIILEIHVVKGEKKNLETELLKSEHLLNYSLWQIIDCPNLKNLYQLSEKKNRTVHHLNISLLDFSKCCKNKPISFMLKETCNVDNVVNCDDAMSDIFTTAILNYLTPHTFLHSAENEADGNKLHDVSMILHYISIGILGFFVFEVSIKIVCVGRRFLNEKFEVVDALIIFTSFMADILFVSLAPQEILVMIVFLLWRIVRVINGLLMHEKQRDEFRVQLQKRARRLSEMKVENLRNKKELYEKHIFCLHDLCKQLGATQDQINNCKPRYMNSTKVQTNNALKSMAAITTGMFSQLVKAGPTNLGSTTSSLLASPVVNARIGNPLHSTDQDANSYIISHHDLSDSQLLLDSYEDHSSLNKLSKSDYKTIVKLFSEPSLLPKRIKSTEL